MLHFATATHTDLHSRLQIKRQNGSESDCRHNNIDRFLSNSVASILDNGTCFCLNELITRQLNYANGGYHHQNCELIHVEILYTRDRSKSHCIHLNAAQFR